MIYRVHWGIYIFYVSAAGHDSDTLVAAPHLCCHCTFKQQLDVVGGDAQKLLHMGTSRFIEPSLGLSMTFG